MSAVPTAQVRGVCFPTHTPHSLLTMKSAPLKVLLVSVVAFASGCSQPATVVVPSLPTAQAGTTSQAKSLAIGTAGCLASACHGASADKSLPQSLSGRIVTDEKTQWESAGSCWAAADPHGGAHSLLTEHPHRPVHPDKTAAKIMARYNPGVAATDDARCLACHTNPALVTPEHMSDPRSRALHAEGVSCEACHGNAGGRDGWIGPHTARDYKGMRSLTDVGDRAMTCLGCHVGAPAGDGYPVRDMNHDMIAAGHPRLNFDFAEFHRRLPPHWHEKNAGPDFEARLWITGRVAHAEAAAKLLHSRAERAKVNDARTPWPEFAEFSCGSCHHEIPKPERVKAALAAGRIPGAPAWQAVWPATHDAMSGLPDLKPLVKILEDRLPEGAPARKARMAHWDQVIGPANTAARQFGEKRTAMKSMPTDKLLTWAWEPFPKLPKTAPDTLDNDEIGQMLLGLAAMERNRLGAPRPDRPAPLKTFTPAFVDILAGKRLDAWSNLNTILKDIKR